MRTLHKQNRHDLRQILLAILLTVFAFIALFSSWGVSHYIAAAEEERVYSNVLDDLRKDPSFYEADYPADTSNHTIEIIQIAESTERDLFVYTYQRNGDFSDFAATDINMSLSENADYTKLYSLTLLNSNGVFGKYKVEDFTVSDKVMRYYSIASVYRKRQNVDGAVDDSLVVNKVAMAVSQRWTAITVDDVIHYYMEYEDVVRILNPFAATVRYDSRHVGWAYKDSHFIAFSTDRRIDTLMEADISYVQEIEYRVVQGVATGRDWTDPEQKDVTVYADDTSSVNTGFFVKRIYTWNNIQTPEEFIASSDNLTDEQKSTIRKNQWVVRFLFTDYIPTPQLVGKPDGTVIATHVSEVTVLRLKFMTDGVVYNLGAVSDIVTGQDIWSGNQSSAGIFSDWFNAFWDNVSNWFKKYGKWILIAVVAVILLIILAPFLPSILSLIVNGVIWLFKGLFWLISAPVRLIIALFKKKDE